MSSDLASESIDADDEAPLRMSQGRRGGDDEMDITPMIDITFLLLIFFVVASKMDPTQAGNTPTAQRGTTVAAKESVVIFMRPGSGDQAEITGSDGTVFSRDEATQTSQVVQYISEELEQLQTGQNQVMILGDRDVSVGEVARIRTIIGDAFEDLPFTYIVVKEE